jgi:hypothetical protein
MNTTTLAELSAILNSSPEIRQKILEVVLTFTPNDAPLNSAPLNNTMHKKPAKFKQAKSAKLTKNFSRPAKRPLNSFMAFRAFYTVIFSQWQQKEASPCLTRMWHEDPFHAKWAIVAKSYSVIRDQVGKAQAPLDHYLQLVCPIIGIIAPEEYLDKMGWNMHDNDSKEIIRTVAPNFANFNAALRTTTMSADDLVRYCQEAGYACAGVQMSKLSSSA